MLGLVAEHEEGVRPHLTVNDFVKDCKEFIGAARTKKARAEKAGREAAAEGVPKHLEFGKANTAEFSLMTAKSQPVVEPFSELEPFLFMSGA